MVVHKSCFTFLKLKKKNQIDNHHFKKFEFTEDTYILNQTLPASLYR